MRKIFLLWVFVFMIASGSAYSHTMGYDIAMHIGSRYGDLATGMRGQEVKVVNHKLQRLVDEINANKSVESNVTLEMVDGKQVYQISIAARRTILDFLSVNNVDLADLRVTLVLSTPSDLSLASRHTVQLNTEQISIALGIPGVSCASIM